MGTLRDLIIPERTSQLPSAPVSPKAVGSYRIAVVDDDDDFRCSLSVHLADQGFDVTECSSGHSALELLKTCDSVDVILLDWRMPEMNGLEVLRELRNRGIATPVIFLTGLSDDIHEDAALAGGAVDFVGKSRLVAILLKRIKLIMERQRSSPDASARQMKMRFGALGLRFDSNRAFWNGSPVDLTLTEFRMVSQLALKAGEDVSYRELYDLVHGKGFVAGYGCNGYRVNVRTFIKRIRKKFRETDTSFAGIENYGGFGYRWASQ